MKLTIPIILLVCLYTSAVHAQGSGDSPPKPAYEITQVSGDLYRFSTGSHNTVFLVTSEGIILADPIAFPSDAPARWLKQQLDERFDVPVKYVIYSHHHLDHAAGGAMFEDTATFIGHENMLKYFETPSPDDPMEPMFAAMDRDNDNRLTKEELGQLSSMFDGMDKDGDGYANSPEVAAALVKGVTPPDRVYSDRMTLKLGGKEIQLIHPGSNHSDDMTVILFPEERVLYGVDFIYTFSGLPGKRPFMYGEVIDWVDSYRTVETLDFDIIAPGHGPIGTKADITLARMAWEDVYETVSAGIAAGKSPEQILAEEPFSDYRHYPDFQSRRQDTINGAYRLMSAQ